MTGRSVVAGSSQIGACTFTVRQSSSAVIAAMGGWTSGLRIACGAMAPKPAASLIPGQGTTSPGLANRSRPTGAAA